MIGRVGQRFGDYRLIRFLGEGTFGDVYFGEQVYEKSPAAVKVFKAKLTPDKFKDFINEVRTVLLRHPNIVQVLDFGIGEDDIPFLVMEFAPNGTLLQRHPRGIRLPLPSVVLYVKQIAAALQYAHDQRRIHRDVKPENILFGAKNELLLSDFGIAAVAHSAYSQRTEEAIGTARYMAPEQWQGKPLPATDQYALGIIVYEWLSGECPFEGGTLQLMYQHLQVPPLPIRAKAPALSPAVEQVIMKVLAKRPQERFARVEDFATALQEASVAPSTAQATIYPSAPPAQTSIPPTTPAPPVRRDAGVAESVVTPPALPITQPEPTPLPATEVAMPAWPDTKTFAPNPTHTKREPEKQRISRREVIITGLGVAGVVAALVGGGVYSYMGYISLHPSNLLYTYRGHSGTVNAVAWSPNGQRIASASEDKTVQVWDATTGGHVYTYRGYSNVVSAVAWSPNGQRIASDYYDTVQVWDASDGGHVYTYRSHQVLCVAWSPGGKYIASGGGDNTVQVWDASGGGHVYTYFGHYNAIRSVAWSPNGQRIASGSDDKTVQVWDATTGGHVYTYRGYSDSVLTVAWSPGGKYIASGGGDNTVQVWDATTGRHIYTYRGHSDFVSTVAWSPDGKRIASASADGTVQVWDATTGDHVYTYRVQPQANSRNVFVNAVAWSPDGKLIASGSTNETVEVWRPGS